MLSPMQFVGIDPVGSSRIGSLPNPRRNTSKKFFETFGSRNKATTCCGFVTALERLADTLLQLCYSFRLSSRDEAATSNDLTLDQSASYYGS